MIATEGVGVAGSGRVGQGESGFRLRLFVNRVWVLVFVLFCLDCSSAPKWSKILLDAGALSSAILVLSSIDTGTTELNIFIQVSILALHQLANQC